MRFQVLPALLFFLICLLCDRVIYKWIVADKGKGLLSRIHVGISAVFSLLFMAVVCMPKRNGSDGMLLFVMWGLLVYISLYIPKIIYVVCGALSRLRRPEVRWLRYTGYALAATTFIAIWWGALVGRTCIAVNRTDVEIKDLPPAFCGFSVAQISDLHLGTYGEDTAYMHKVVEEVNRLKPDVIVFTGDLVNRRSREAVPFVPVLSRLKARHGVYGILGNHDYGDYSDWPDDAARQQDASSLCDMMRDMGWTVLHNDTRWLHVEGDSVALIGVGNISRPPFMTYGNLKTAYPDISDKNIKLLLTHNPEHWTDEICGKRDANVQLTLAGHTHAFQISAGPVSPAALRYDVWRGLNTDSLGHKIYVNTGIGTEGVPLRIGATPEITLLTLKPARK